MSKARTGSSRLCQFASPHAGVREGRARISSLPLGGRRGTHFALAPQMQPGPLQRLRRFVLAVSIIATGCLVSWVALDVGRLLWAGSWSALILGITLGVIAIDFVTGLVHWACDRLGSPSTPLLGPFVIRAFREHHDDPNAIVEHDWIETNGESSILPLVALLGLVWFQPRAGSWLSAMGIACLWTMALFGAMANQAHKWAHSAVAPRSVRLLQRTGLILSPDRHARHHRASHDQAYCISTGWMNPLLDRMGVWSWLERSLKGST